MVRCPKRTPQFMQNRYIHQGDESDDEDSSDDSRDDDAPGKGKWKLFEQFKMGLYAAKKKEARPEGEAKKGEDEEEEDPDDYKVSINKRLKALDGQTEQSEKVFVAALTFMKEHAFECFRKKNVDITDPKEVKWVLTVPAIWSDRAKDIMRTWAGQAGICEKSIQDHLIIAYEPECASISIQHELR